MMRVKLSYTRIHARPSGCRRSRALSAVALAGAAYALGYAVAYAGREPAANMAYWVYGDDWDRPARVFFHPAYLVHRHLLGGHRHTNDRPEFDQRSIGP